ncbi:response regulator [Sedimenticola sp.]|uniref:response regulator n=1 Tax=Sedimenticola sp. TaxID=1940285 RepID=UPI003D098B55
MTEITHQSTILMVEDDLKLATLTSEFLQSHNFLVVHEADGQRALERVHALNPDLLILDLNLPGLDGLEICRRVRPTFGGPILMLTARDEDVDQILGLELGADDYVIKPAKPRVILARIHALLRRQPKPNESRIDEAVIEHGSLSIRRNAREVVWLSRLVKLSTNEYDLLQLFATHPGEILSREIISRTVRGLEYDGLDRWVDILVSRLRSRFGDDSQSPRRIKTVWGKGYLFVSDAWQESDQSK